MHRLSAENVVRYYENIIVLIGTTTADREAALKCVADICK